MKQYDWREAEVEAVEQACSDMVALRVRPDEWIPHLAGQHYEIRFPGENLCRKFSIVSSPLENETLEFGIQVRPKGMLTPRLAASGPGDRLQLRGPTGVAFAWRPDDDGPLLLVGAGAGVTPLVSMYETRTRAAAGDEGRLTLFLLAARAPDRVFRLARYEKNVRIRYSSTEGRFDRESLAAAIPPAFLSSRTRARVCGPSSFMTDVVECLLDLGICPDKVRAEAFV